jgi:hypothetical protein
MTRDDENTARPVREFRLPKEVASGLSSLLFATAAKASAASRTVVTTSPGLWVPFGTAGNLTIIDVSRLVGAVGWETERDVENRTIQELIMLGWPEKLIRSGNRRGPDIFTLLA